MPAGVVVSSHLPAATAADTATDLVVLSSVSNWGVTGVIAALSALLETAVVFHEPELEVRSIENGRLAAVDLEWPDRQAEKGGHDVWDL